MEELKYAEARATFRSGAARFSARIDTVGPEPPEKPPWQQFMDLNWNALKWLAGSPIVRWAAGSAIWDTLFSRRRQPAEAWQV